VTNTSRRLRSLVVVLLFLAGAVLVAAGLFAPSAHAAASCTSFTSRDSWPDAPSGYYHHIPSVGAQTGNFNCVLGYGNNSLAVKALQESLNACYYQGLDPDGDFGPATRNAVRNAQRAINSAHPEARLVVDGVYGPRTSLYFRYQAYDHNNGGAHTGLCSRRF
jgi:hypothetical protein